MRTFSSNFLLKFLKARTIKIVLNTSTWILLMLGGSLSSFKTLSHNPRGKFKILSGIRPLMACFFSLMKYSHLRVHQTGTLISRVRWAPRRRVSPSNHAHRRTQRSIYLWFPIPVGRPEAGTSTFLIRKESDPRMGWRPSKRLIISRVEKGNQIFALMKRRTILRVLIKETVRSRS